MKQETCAAKIGQPGRNGMQVCGKPVEYRAYEDHDEWWQISGWYHVTPGPTHHAVPSRYVR